MKLLFFLLGPPLSGKSTIVKLLKERLLFDDISIGAILREKAKNDITIAESLKSGVFLSEDIIINIVSEEIKRLSASNRILLDGYPRTIEQLPYISTVSKGFDKILTVYLSASQDLLYSRLEKRYICANCGRDKTFSHQEYCECGSASKIKRLDDEVETFKKRLSHFFSTIPHILQHMQTIGSVINVDASCSSEDLIDIIERNVF